MIHENIELTGSFVVSGSFVLPNHPNTGSVSALTGSVYHDTTDNILKVYTGNAWVTVGEQTASTPPPPADTTPDIEYLVVAGGGGSAYDGGGGGGAGGFLSSSIADVESGSVMTITVGAGGNVASNGTDSSLASTSGTSFSTITSVGGGTGAGAGNSYTAGSGGSGGGGAGGQYNNPGGSGTVGQGNDGGTSGTSGGGTTYPGSGGGGAGEAGGEGVNSGGAGKPGGAGKQTNITGTATYFAGGGGGASGGGGGGAGGSGGGGAGGNSAQGTAGTANTGGGAGGSNITSGVTGGSGVVILAYNSGSGNGAGGIVGAAGNGRKYHQFNTTGTFKVGSTSDFGIVTDSLVAHYDAGNFASRGTSTWTDLTGTSNGSVTNATLGQNFYYSFDGSGDYIDLGSIDTFSGGEYTMEAWCKVPAFSSPALMSIFTLQDNIYAYMFIYADGSFRLNTETSSGTANLYTSTGYDDGNWHHVVATYTPGLLSAYVDNTADGTNTSGTGNPNSNDGWSLVGGYDASKASLSQAYPLLGDVAQIRVYNKALTAAEISQNYNATKTNFL